MSRSSDRSWTKSELYEFLCLIGIAECIWLAGVKLELFASLHEFALQHGLSDLMMLGSIMSVALAGASAYRSVRLRREMAGRAEAEEQAQTLARHDSLT